VHLLLSRPAGNTVFNSFYDSLKHIRDYHRKATTAAMAFFFFVIVIFSPV
jgi:hypothetical protein